MKHYIIKVLALGLLITSSVIAEEYRDPSTFGAEEYEVVSIARDDYMICLQDESMALIDTLEDPRQMADVAMKTCANILEKLYNNITMQGFAPNVARKFTTNISNKGANAALRNLMIISSRKKAEQAQTDNE